MTPEMQYPHWFLKECLLAEAIAEVGYLAGLCGYNNPDWLKVIVDSSGHLQVDVLSITDGLESYPTTPTIYNVTMTLANTEYSRALPASTKRFMIQCRGTYAIKLAFTSGQSGTTYITIPSGGNYWEDTVKLTSKTLYFQCATAAQVAEIITWS